MPLPMAAGAQKMQMLAEQSTSTRSNEAYHQYALSAERVVASWWVIPTLMAAMFSTLMLTSTAAPAVHTPASTGGGRGGGDGGVVRTDEHAEQAGGGCLQGAVPSCVLLATPEEAAVCWLVVKRLEGRAISAGRAMQHVLALMRCAGLHAQHPCVKLYRDDGQRLVRGGCEHNNRQSVSKWLCLCRHSSEQLPLHMMVMMANQPAALWPLDGKMANSCGGKQLYYRHYHQGLCFYKRHVGWCTMAKHQWACACSLGAWTLGLGWSDDAPWEKAGCFEHQHTYYMLEQHTHLLVLLCSKNQRHRPLLHQLTQPVVFGRAVLCTISHSLNTCIPIHVGGDVCLEPRLAVCKCSVDAWFLRAEEGLHHDVVQVFRALRAWVPQEEHKEHLGLLVEWDPVQVVVDWGRCGGWGDETHQKTSTSRTCSAVVKSASMSLCEARCVCIPALRLPTDGPVMAPKPCGILFFALQGLEAAIRRPYVAKKQPVDVCGM